MNENELKELISNITPADSAAAEAARLRQAKLAKPPGSLGKLEDISIRLAGITGKVLNSLERRAVLVFAADNGVVKEGVAVTPQSVTLSQCINMTEHKTGMSALAHFFGDRVRVTDVGVKARFTHPGIVDRKVRLGTRDLLIEPAMTRAEALAALAAGVEAVREEHLLGVDVIGVGEMGIGNTTTSAAVLACLTGLEVSAVTGRGSGLNDEAYEHKKQVISQAIIKHAPDSADPLDVISKVGGLDIAAMTGAYLGCALLRVPAVADGFISIVAALCAVRLCPAARDYIFLSHASMELGYRSAARELGLEPCLDLDMRLGEGSGCPIAFQIMRAACAAMNGMATFEEAAIDDKYLEGIRGFDAFGGGERQ